MGEAGYTATGQMRWLKKPNGDLVLQQYMRRTGWVSSWIDIPVVAEEPKEDSGRQNKQKPLQSD